MYRHDSFRDQYRFWTPFYNVVLCHDGTPLAGFIPYRYLGSIRDVAREVGFMRRLSESHSGLSLRVTKYAPMLDSDRPESEVRNVKLWEREVR